MTRTGVAVFAALALALLGAAATVSVGLNIAGKGLLVGGIQACTGLADSPQHYVAGTVSVDGGAFTTLEDGAKITRPGLVAQDEVADHGRYFFVLDKGSYTVTGAYRNSSVDSSAPVEIRSGWITFEDVPNRCI